MMLIRAGFAAPAQLREWFMEISRWTFQRTKSRNETRLSGGSLALFFMTIRGMPCSLKVVKLLPLSPGVDKKKTSQYSPRPPKVAPSARSTAQSSRVSAEQSICGSADLCWFKRKASPCEWFAMFGAAINFGKRRRLNLRLIAWVKAARDLHKKKTFSLFAQSNDYESEMSPRRPSGATSASFNGSDEKGIKICPTCWWLSPPLRLVLRDFSTISWRLRVLRDLPYRWIIDKRIE